MIETKDSDHATQPIAECYEEGGGTVAVRSSPYSNTVTENKGSDDASQPIAECYEDDGGTVALSSSPYSNTVIETKDSDEAEDGGTVALSYSVHNNDVEYSIGAESDDTEPLSLPGDDELDDNIELAVIGADDDSVGSIDYADI